jgi:hypothetical protein
VSQILSNDILETYLVKLAKSDLTFVFITRSGLTTVMKINVDFWESLKPTIRQFSASFYETDYSVQLLFRDDKKFNFELITKLRSLINALDKTYKDKSYEAWADLEFDRLDLDDLLSQVSIKQMLKLC